MKSSASIPGIRPPGGRRPWIIPTPPLNQVLEYLAWGVRRYGDHAMPQALQSGYTYIYILQGNPVIQCGQQAVCCEPGMFFLLDRATALGWSARRGDQQLILCWIWHDPPSLPELRPSKGQFIQLRLDANAHQKVSQLHRLTRGEVSRPDPFSLAAMRALKTTLDVRLARSRIGATFVETDAAAVENMIEWMRSHLNSTRPVADLCDWSGFAAQSLRRQFMDATGVSPLVCFNRLKAEEATRRLLAGDSVKAVAYQLGYRHVHDFSRFYQNQTGNLPSRIGG